MSHYDIELDQIRLDVPRPERDNYIAIQDALLKIQEMLDDIHSRLEALE